MANCTHTYPDGISALVFPKKAKWKGIHPNTVTGICRLCNNQVTISWKSFMNRSQPQYD